VTNVSCIVFAVSTCTPVWQTELTCHMPHSAKSVGLIGTYVDAKNASKENVRLKFGAKRTQNTVQR